MQPSKPGFVTWSGAGFSLQAICTPEELMQLMQFAA